MTSTIKLAIPAAAALVLAPMAHAQTATGTTAPMTDAPVPAADATTTTMDANTTTMDATTTTMNATNIVLAENLVGADVRAIEMDDATWGNEYYVDPYTYDADMEDVGDVDDVALGTDGTMKGLIVDVGGFLGLGVHRVMLTPDQFRVYRQDNWGADYQIVSRLTRDELEALPEFDRGD